MKTKQEKDRRRAAIWIALVGSIIAAGVAMAEGENEEHVTPTFARVVAIGGVVVTLGPPHDTVGPENVFYIKVWVRQ